MEHAAMFASAGGFTILHASQCQPKNSTSVIIANLLSIGTAVLVFWACGFAFAYGDGTFNSSNFFLSYTRFFLIDATGLDYANFVREVAVCCLVVVIANSGFIARMKHWLYPLTTIVVAGFVYPCVRHWTYHPEGWLVEGISFNDGFVKYADVYGAGSIHIFAGSASLVGTILLSPRKERRYKNFPELGGEITPVMLLGGILATFGLLSKNATSAQGMVNTLLSAQASAIVAFLFSRLRLPGNKNKTKSLINGAIAGIVSTSCSADLFHPYGGFVVGVVGGMAFVFWNCLLSLCRVDDPTQTISTHLGAGMWGVLAGPLFRKGGVVYNTSTNNLNMFGWHLLAGIAIFVWTGIILFFLLIPFVLAKVDKHRDPSQIDTGLDLAEHREPAYPDRDTYAHQEERVYFDQLYGKEEMKSSLNGAFYEMHEPSRQQQQDVIPMTIEERQYQEWKETVAAKYK